MFCKDVLNDYFACRNTNISLVEMQTLYYMIWFDAVVLLLPDNILDDIINIFNVPACKFNYIKNVVPEISNALSVFTLFGEECDPIPVLKNQFTERVLPEFNKWLQKKILLFVGIEIYEEEYQFIKNIEKNRKNFAIISKDNNFLTDEQFSDINILPLRIDIKNPNILKESIHKLLVDSRNKKMEKKYSFLDFRYSRHPLIGRESEIQWLNEFLKSDATQSKLKWTIVYGDIFSGKSRLLYDFVCSVQKDWNCYFVNHSNKDPFFSKYKTSKMHKENSLIVFDDYYLNDSLEHDFLEILEIFEKFKQNIRIIFVYREKTDICKILPDLASSVSYLNGASLEVKYLSDENIVDVCCSYAEYLISCADKSVEELKRMNVREEIDSYIKKLNKNDALKMYLCMIKVLEILGLLDGNASNIKYVLSYINSTCKTDITPENIFLKYKEIFEKIENNKSKKPGALVSNQIEINEHEEGI